MASHANDVVQPERKRSLKKKKGACRGRSASVSRKGKALRKRAEGEQKKTHKKQTRRQRSKSRTRACRNNQDDGTRKRIIRNNSRTKWKTIYSPEAEAPPSPSRLLSPIAMKRNAQYLERIKKQKQQEQAVESRYNEKLRTALNGTIAIERETSRRRLQRDANRAGTPTKRNARARTTRRIEYIAKEKHPVPFRTSLDILMDEINAVTTSNQALLDKREAEKLRLKLRLEKKDKELQMLREELEKMKIEREREREQEQEQEHHQLVSPQRHQ